MAGDYSYGHMSKDCSRSRENGAWRGADPAEGTAPVAVRMGLSASLGRSEGVEQRPVELARIHQHPGAVVGAASARWVDECNVVGVDGEVSGE